MAAAKVPKQRRPYRRWSICDKRRIVELTLPQGASARAIAREYGISHNSLCRWKALYRAGKLDGPLPRARAHADSSAAAFLPVTIAPAKCAPKTAGGISSGGLSIVELSLPSGARLRIETDALDSAVLCVLIEQLQR